jgi:hypothetical protein
MNRRRIWLALLLGGTVVSPVCTQAAVLRYEYEGPVFAEATGPFVGGRITALIEIDCAAATAGCRRVFLPLLNEFSGWRNPALKRFRVSAGDVVFDDASPHDFLSLWIDTGPDASPIAWELALFDATFSAAVESYQNDLGGVEYVFEGDAWGRSESTGTWTVTPIPGPPGVLLLLTSLAATVLAAQRRNAAT